MMNRTKIGWCDYTWNPVWGCLNNCAYCYARKIAKRFYKNMVKKENISIPLAAASGTKKNDLKDVYNDTKKYLTGRLRMFKPVFLDSNYYKPLPKKPCRIFVNSMSDIKFWEPFWIEKVLSKIITYPAHRFLFLTKFPEVYDRYSFPKNCWLGYTSTDGEIYNGHLLSRKYDNGRFISFEPLFQRVNREALIKDIKFINWIIVGAQTHPYVPPAVGWIRELKILAIEHGVPLFMKHNLAMVWPDLVQQFPE